MIPDEFNVAPYLHRGCPDCPHALGQHSRDNGCLAMVAYGEPYTSPKGVVSVSRAICPCNNNSDGLLHFFLCLDVITQVKAADTEGLK